jgi:hypothetical protein
MAHLRGPVEDVPTTIGRYPYREVIVPLREA